MASEGSIALGANATYIQSDAATVARALDSVDLGTASSASIANKAIDSANLFASRATASQNDVIAATTAQTKAAYDFASEASKSGNERITSDVIKYGLIAAAILAALFLLPSIFRKKPAASSS